METINDKRSETRINCHKTVQVIMSDATSVEMIALNYCMGGVGVTGSMYQVIPQVGEQLNVNFTLDSRQVNINGVVKYINLEGGLYYLGLGL